MAGFYIVGMALIFIIILLVIMGFFEIMSILSIIFSSVSLNKSKKYVLSGGVYGYGSVKRFHTAAVVFFIFGCIGAFFTALSVPTVITEFVSGDGAEEFMGALPFYLLILGKYTVLIVLGIKSFVKFADAKNVQRVLYQNAAMRNPYYNGYNAPNYGYRYGQGHPAANVQTQAAAPSLVYVRNDNYRAEVVSGDSGLSFSTQASGEADDSEGKSAFVSEALEKICPKCGERNSALYKFCTLCGEKLE